MVAIYLLGVNGKIHSFKQFFILLINISTTSFILISLEILIMSNYLSKLSDKVWFTYTARIQTHKRLKFNEFCSNFILVYYSLSILIVSIVTLTEKDFYGNIEHTNLMSTILSAIILVTSLMIVNVNYQLRAVRMRDNYLELQKLYEEIKLHMEHNSIINQHDEEKFKNHYVSILEKHENHITFDDIANRLQTETNRGVSCYEKFLYYGYRIVKWMLLIAIIILPTYLIFKPLLFLQYY